MRIVRFRSSDQVSFGAIEGDEVAELAQFPAIAAEPTGRTFSLGEVQLLAPVEPTKIVCVGLNFADHADEVGQALQAEPLMFFKPPSSIVGPGDKIVLPHQSNQVELEVELAMVISQTAKNVPIEKAADYLLGWTVANDVTARDLQFSDLQWARSKGFDTFCPLGPWIETEFNPADHYLESRVNSELAQRESVQNMIFDPLFLLSYVSQNVTLNPQDIILTGSPAGISKISSGDIVECEISGIGVLRNQVA